jgi:hypothetical protein
MWAQLGHGVLLVLALLWAGLQSPAFKHAAMGGAAGLAVAARVDWVAFAGWKSIEDALTYDWGVAIWRWFQGAVIGAAGVTGFGAWLG